MKILFVVDDFKGGSFNACHIVCDYLKAKHEVFLIVLNKSVETRYSMEGIVCLVNTRANNGVRGFCDDIKFVKKHAKSINPDVVVSFLFGVSVCTYLAIKSMKSIVFICSERSNPFVLKPKFPLNMLVNAAYHRADSVVILFDYFKNAYKKNISKKCVTIANAVLNPPIHSIPNGSPKRIVTYGNNIAYKGYDLVVEAVPYCLKHNKDFIVEIYGNFRKKELEDRIKELNVSEYIKLFPYNEKVYEILNGAYAYLMVSRVEGFPNSLLEGLSVGLPGIVFPCHEGIKEIISQENGICIECNTPESISEGVLKAIYLNNDEYERKSMNASLIIDKYGINTIGKQWERLIKNCNERRNIDETL